MKTGFKRDFYLEKIIPYIDQKEMIKVLVGQRRVGKSYILKQLIQYLQQERGVQSSHVIFVNLEVDYMLYPTVQHLDDYIRSHMVESGTYYLCIDEVQEVYGREKLINAYRANDAMDIDIIVTGSNAHILSSDLSTYVTGRYIDIEIMPFSYREYLGYYERENNKESFLSYMSSTGIAALYALGDEEGQINFARAIKDSIILKDVVKRHNVRDVDLLEKIFFYLVDNIGNLFSLNAMVKKLQGEGVSTNTNTLGNYIYFLEQTYIIHGVSRYDLKGKKILEGQKKYYLNDLCFRNYFSSSYDIGGGKKLENIVYNHLRQCGYRVFVGNIDAMEVDFIAQRGKETLYVQVAHTISSESVFEREFGNLLKISDQYPKIVLTLDDVLTPYRGIQHYRVYDYLYGDV